MKNITLKIFVLIVFFFCSIHFSGFGQSSRTIKVYILNEHFEPVPYVKFFHSDTVLLGETDINGKVLINISEEVQRIKAVSIGYMKTEIIINSDCINIDVIMLVHVLYDFTPDWKVRWEEKRRFIKLSKLHKEAYKRDLFLSKEPCYKIISPTIPQIWRKEN